MRALEALRKGADETARLERVGAKLGPLLDAPPPSMPAKPSAGSASYKLTVLKLMVAGLVLLAPVLWMMRRDGSAKPQKEQAPSEVTSVAKPPEPSRDEADRAATTQGGAPVPPPDASAQRREVRRRRARPSRDRAEESRGAEGRGAPHARGQVESGPAIAASDSTRILGRWRQRRWRARFGVRARASARAAEPSSPIPTPTPKPSATQAAAPRPMRRVRARLRPRLNCSFAARKAMPDDPARALRLLTDHQRHYPEGVFVPEREVLAIEALRGLGRTAEANARLRLFKARYPNSFHLQRLEK